MLEKKPESKSSLAYAKLFLVLVGFILILSAVIKIGSLILSRNFTDTSYTFLVLEKDAYIVRVDSLDKTVSIAKITHVSKQFYNANKRYQEVYLGVPIEGEIRFKDRPKSINFLQNFFSFPNMIELLVRRDKILYKNLNPVDIVEIFVTSWFAQNRSIATFSLSDFDTQVFLKTGMDVKMGNLFRDSNIFNEATSIEVDNATNENGLGAQVAGMLRDVGYNVVIVASQSLSNHTSIINRAGQNTTTNSLRLIFNVPLTTSTQSAQADINIIIGSDFYK